MSIQPLRPPDSETIELRGVVDVVHRWRRTLTGFVVGVCVLTAIVLILTPNTYTSRTNIRPESGQEVLGGLQQFLSAQLGPMAGKLGKEAGSALDDFVILLRGRQLAGQVVDALDLVTVYEIDEADRAIAREKAIETLRKSTTTKVTDQFTISFSATDRNPNRAAEIVTHYLGGLEEANRQFSRKRASGLRAFLEVRLQDANMELNRSLDSLQNFQVANGTADMIEQSKVTVEVVGKMQGELVALETNRDALATFRTDNHTQMRQLDSRIDALRAQIQSMTAAPPDASAPLPADGKSAGLDTTGDQPGALLALGSLPALARAHALLLLDVEVQKSVFGLLTSQYEQAKIDEAKNTDTIRVLDPPTVPYEKSAPKRTLTLLAAAVGATLLGLLMIFIFDRLVDPSLRTERGRIRHLNRTLRNEWFRWAH